MPHLRVAYETRHQRAGDHTGPVYNTLHPAEACKTACTTSHCYVLTQRHLLTDYDYMGKR